MGQLRQDSEGCDDQKKVLFFFFELSNATRKAFKLYLRPLRPLIFHS